MIKKVSNRNTYISKPCLCAFSRHTLVSKTFHNHFREMFIYGKYVHRKNVRRNVLFSEKKTARKILIP